MCLILIDSVEKKEQTEIRTTAFQRTRVDALLADLTKKFPPPTSEEENPKLPSNPPAVARKCNSFLFLWRK